MRSRSNVTDVSLTGMLARTPSMLLHTIRVGPNTYIDVLTTEGVDKILLRTVLC
jgi:hypothetical protein